MKKESYDKFSNWFEAHPKAAKALLGTDSVITYIIVVSFVALHIHYFISKDYRMLASTLIICGLSFVACTVLRKIVNEARPYESFDIKPIRRRKKTGDSFPSRHAFSIFCIGVAFFQLAPALGIVIFALGVVLCTVRVIEGVHYPHDVILGALMGAAATSIGFWLSTIFR